MNSRTRGSTSTSTSTRQAKPRSKTAKGSTSKTKAKKTKEAPKKTKKEVKEELPKIPGIKDDAITKQLINLLKKNYRVEAVCKFRLATGMTLEKATRELEKFWNEEILRHINVDDYKNLKNCYSCSGFCGRKAELVRKYGEKLFSADNNAPVGSTCSEWGDRNRIIALLKCQSERVGIQLRNYKRERSPFIIIKAHEGVIKIEKNRTDFSHQIVKKDETLEKVADIVIEMLKEATGFDKVFDHTDTFIKGGITPTPGESWETYISRISEEVRKKRVEVENQFNEMTEEKMLVEFKKYAKAKGIFSIMESYEDDVDSFIEDFFPGKTMREVLVSLYKEQYR